MDDIQVSLAADFTRALGKNSYDWVKGKIEHAKNINNEQEKEVIYNEVINNLMNDKAQFESLARQYKTLYERVTISDEDIEYLHNTIRNVMTLINEKLIENDQEKITEELLNAILGLLSKETLKTMQLLGFNYKEAIGVPLTELCADFLKNKLSNNM